MMKVVTTSRLTGTLKDQAYSYSKIYHETLGEIGGITIKRDEATNEATVDVGGLMLTGPELLYVPGRDQGETKEGTD